MIRPFSISDLDQILQIEEQAFPKSPYDWTTFINLHSLCPDTFWVYADVAPDRRGSKILGYVIFSKDGHVISIAVAPLFRRRGIGKEMLQRAMETLPGKRMWAEVRKSNHVAQSFYFKMGFQVVGETPGYYGSEDALIIQWTPQGSVPDHFVRDYPDDSPDESPR